MTRQFDFLQLTYVQRTMLFYKRFVENIKIKFKIFGA